METIEFQNLTMIISIIIGVGFTKLLTSLSDVLRTNEIKVEPLYLMWVVIMFILNIEFIWNLRLQTKLSLSLLRAIIYLLGPISLFFMTDSLTVHDRIENDISKLPNQMIFFVYGILYFASQVLVAYLIKDEAFIHPQNLFRYAAIGLCLSGVWLRVYYFHLIIAAFSLLTLFSYIFMTDRLQF